jgi:hypothetical protein
MCSKTCWQVWAATEYRNNDSLVSVLDTLDLMLLRYLKLLCFIHSLLLSWLIPCLRIMTGSSVFAALHAIRRGPKSTLDLLVIAGSLAHRIIIWKPSSFVGYQWCRFDPSSRPAMGSKLRPQDVFQNLLAGSGAAKCRNFERPHGMTDDKGSNDPFPKIWITFNALN